MQVHKELVKKYEDHYEIEEEVKNEWRKIGAKQKAENILNTIPFEMFNSVVEIGAGEGFILYFLNNESRFKKFTAVEISQTAINQIEKRNLSKLEKVVKFDGYMLPFKDNQFDLAICSHVIEHVEHPRLLLREIQRVSKYHVFEIPIDFTFSVHKKLNHFLGYGHINIYTPSLFKFLLLSEKFKIRNERYSMTNLHTLKMTYKGNFIAYTLVLIKRLIWFIFPFLKRIKPNAYTVFTS